MKINQINLKLLQFCRKYKNNISGVSLNFEVKKLFPNVHVGVELKTTYFINTSEMFSLLSGVIVECVVTETLPRR